MMTATHLTELSNILSLPLMDVGIFDPHLEGIMSDDWPISWVLSLRTNPGNTHNLLSTPLSPRTVRCLACLNEWRQTLFEEEIEVIPPPEITEPQRQTVASLLPLLTA
jgi:hypothetical protein